MTPPHLVVTDLDGTLLGSASRLGGANRRALEALGRNGTVRVVATGRSLYSARTVMPADFPIDYLVFSSGAGVVSWADERLLRSRAMAPPVVSGSSRGCAPSHLDFMVHHRGARYALFPLLPLDVRQHPTFERRIERYARFSQHLGDGAPGEVEVSQLLVVEPPGSASCLALLAREFEDVHVVRTTSPLDHASTWIELFPIGGCRSRTPRTGSGRGTESAAPARSPSATTTTISTCSNGRTARAWSRMRRRRCVCGSRWSGRTMMTGSRMRCVRCCLTGDRRDRRSPARGGIVHSFEQAPNLPLLALSSRQAGSPSRTSDFPSRKIAHACPPGSRACPPGFPRSR